MIYKNPPKAFRNHYDREMFAFVDVTSFQTLHPFFFLETHKKSSTDNTVKTVIIIALSLSANVMTRLAT